MALALAAIAALLVLRNAWHESAWSRLHDDGDGRRSGSVDLPRPGRYLFGCQACAGATITVNDRAVALRPDRDNPDVLAGPLDLDAGVGAIAIAAPPGARLLWHPPGRRGPLEYLLPSSLSPDPPERARFPSWAGAAPLDGAIAIAIGLIVLGLGAWLLRARLRAIDRPTALALCGVFALALAVRLWDLGGAGQTFDEDVYWSAGRDDVENRLGLDFAQRSWIWNLQHPPVMKDLDGAPALLEDGYGTARALSALEVAAACALLCAIGTRLWCRRAGVAAGLAAALTPHLVAHGQIVGHEAPTVLGWMLAIYLCVAAFDREPGTRTLAIRFAWIGVVLGLAVSTRFVNGLLAPAIGAVLLVRAPPALLRRTLGYGLAVIPAVAMATCVIVWPRLWVDPIGHLREAWTITSRGHGPEIFLGAMTEHPPHTYFLRYLFATAPLGILLGVAAFAWRAASRRHEWRATATALLVFAIPLAAEVSPVRQDGVRYVMPSVCALALMAGAGVDLLAGLAQRWRREAGPAVVAVLGVYLAVVCARIHPYYLDYYGEQVGGPSRVAATRDYELGWWGEGVDDAVAYVAAHERPGDRVYRDWIEALHLAWWPYDVWGHLATSPADADWIVVQPALAPHALPPGFTLVHTTWAQGAPLVRVYHRE